MRMALSRMAAATAMLLLALFPPPAAALDLFARHTVTVQFATPQGQPMANAPVQVFAPGKPHKPALAGRTDSHGKFEFAADRDGFWSAEARSGTEIARVMILVGGRQQVRRPISPYWLWGGFVLLLVLALGFRILRARARRPKD